MGVFLHLHTPSCTPSSHTCVPVLQIHNLTAADDALDVSCLVKMAQSNDDDDDDDGALSHCLIHRDYNRN